MQSQISPDISADQIKSIRTKVLKNQGYLPKEFQKSILLNTEKALLEAQPEKRQMFGNFMDSLRVAAAASPAVVGSSVVTALSIFNKSTSLDQAAETIEKEKTKLHVAANPNRSKYIEGRVYPIGRKSYKCVGYSPVNGDPLMELQQ